MVDRHSFVLRHKVEHDGQRAHRHLGLFHQRRRLHRFSDQYRTGNVWQTVTSPLAGLTLHNGDTITFRDTFSGAVGNNGNLDFDNIQMTSIVVPEPAFGVLVALGVGVAVRRSVDQQTGRLSHAAKTG